MLKVSIENIKYSGIKANKIIELIKENRFIIKIFHSDYLLREDKKYIIITKRNWILFWYSRHLYFGLEDNKVDINFEIH